MDKIIQALIQARKQKGLSQTVFGQKLGIPQSHISKIEKGIVDLRLSSLVDMARLLGFEIVMVPRELLPVIHNLTTSPTPEGEEKSLPEMLLSQSNEELE